MSFDLWFPTAILSEQVKDYKKINQNLLPRIKEIKNSIDVGGKNWIGKPYNTCGTFNIVEDPAFSDVIKEINAWVHFYASRLGIDTSRHKFVSKEGWLNIYHENDFQEFHHHAGHQFSVVYYVKVPENSSNIIFESPLPPDMNPLPITLRTHITDTRAYYNVQEGQIIIFRSNLRHCVPNHKGSDERISLAFNYDLK